jgi:tetratricopeptide (TPR) repeat protein
MPGKKKDRVFLSYAHENLDMVRQIYAGLKERQIDVWFDKADLGPGLWKRKIEKAIPKCRYFIICLSEAALKKVGDESPGFQDEELQQAYEIARVQPEGDFTIVPVRLEDCDRGDHRLSPYQQYDLFNDFNSELDNLSINLGGVSLADKFAKDTRSEDEKFLENLHNNAITFFYAGELDKSLAIFSSLVVLKPDGAETWFNKGVVLSGLGRNDEAIEAYDKALEINPDDAKVWNNKGTVLSGLGRNDEAIEAYDKALEINPDDAKVWYNKGNALYALGRNDEAIEAYDKDLEINPDDAKVWNNKGTVLSDLGRK